VVWRDRAELDLAPPSGRDLDRPGDRLVKIGRLQHEVAGQDFFASAYGPSVNMTSPPLPPETVMVVDIVTG